MKMQTEAGIFDLSLAFSNRNFFPPALCLTVLLIARIADSIEGRDKVFERDAAIFSNEFLSREENSKRELEVDVYQEYELPESDRELLFNSLAQHAEKAQSDGELDLAVCLWSLHAVLEKNPLYKVHSSISLFTTMLTNLEKSFPAVEELIEPIR